MFVIGCILWQRCDVFPSEEQIFHLNDIFTKIQMCAGPSTGDKRSDNKLLMFVLDERCYRALVLVTMQ